MKKMLVPACFILFGFFMIIVVLHLSPVGDPRLPSYAGYINPQTAVENIPKTGQSAALYYNKNAVSDSNAMSAICAMILDYRGYDTLYEATVLFTAIICVLSVLGFDSGKGFSISEYRKLSINVSDISRRMVPFILLFGIYIILHGHLSAGGGFQGGVVIGAGFIIYAIVFGREKALHYVPEDVIKVTNSLGTSIYAAIGLLGIIFGYNFLANKVAGIPPIGQPGVLLSAGTLFGINIGIGMNVSSTMIRLFFAFKYEEKEEVSC
ncbi:MAG: MnhB domain-containing protein [bacterium]